MENASRRGQFWTLVQVGGTRPPATSSESAKKKVQLTVLIFDLEQLHWSLYAEKTRFGGPEASTPGPVKTSMSTVLLVVPSLTQRQSGAQTGVQTSAGVGLGEFVGSAFRSRPWPRQAPIL
jgi:hypothetical protein